MIERGVIGGAMRLIVLVTPDGCVAAAWPAVAPGSGGDVFDSRLRPGDRRDRRRGAVARVQRRQRRALGRSRRRRRGDPGDRRRQLRAEGDRAASRRHEARGDHQGHLGQRSRIRSPSAGPSRAGSSRSSTRKGNTAVYTGPEGDRRGPGTSRASTATAQGNILAGEGVVDGMVEGVRGDAPVICRCG